jgi:hypothetical protein
MGMSKIKKRPKVYLTKRVLMDPRTGEQVVALVPVHKAARIMLNDLKLGRDEQVRCEFTRARNVKFWGLAHALGQSLVEHVEGFEALNAHQAIKRVQFEAGVECECERFDIPGLGSVERRVPRSLAFDEMDEAEFRRVYGALCDYIGLTYFSGLDEDAVSHMVQMMPEAA